MLFGGEQGGSRTIIDFTLTPDDAIYSETNDNGIVAKVAYAEIDLSRYAEGTYSGYLQIGNEQIVNIGLMIPIDYPSQKLIFKHSILTSPFKYLMAAVLYPDGDDNYLVGSQSADITASSHFYMELNE